MYKVICEWRGHLCSLTSIKTYPFQESKSSFFFQTFNQLCMSIKKPWVVDFLMVNMYLKDFTHWHACLELILSTSRCQRTHLAQQSQERNQRVVSDDELFWLWILGRYLNCSFMVIYLVLLHQHDCLLQNPINLWKGAQQLQCCRYFGLIV